MHSSQDGSNRKVLLRVTIPGIPRPKGSVAVRDNGSVKESETTERWCQAVAMMARQASGLRRVGREWFRLDELEHCEPHSPHTGPVSVSLTFRMRGEPTAKPDIDKLIRAILDSISAGTSWGTPILKDDSLVVRISSVKLGPCRNPGVDIAVVESD